MMRYLAAVFLLLLLLTGCAERAAPAHTHPEQAQAVEPTETAEAPEMQEEPDYGEAAFCGGITLFAGATLALVNSEDAAMEGAPFLAGDDF